MAHYVQPICSEFYHNGTSYRSGTKIIYNGPCKLDGKIVELNNVVMTWKYMQGVFVYFEYNGKTYRSDFREFFPCLVDVIDENAKPKQKEEIWTDGMVAATIWYIVIMLFGTICKDNVTLWIVATIIWRSYIKKNKITIWR